MILDLLEVHSNILLNIDVQSVYVFSGWIGLAGVPLDKQFQTQNDKIKDNAKAFLNFVCSLNKNNQL